MRYQPSLKTKLPSLIQESLGLKLGVTTGLAVFLIVLILVGIFSAMQVPLISKFSMIHILVGLAILMACFSILVISIATNLLVQKPLQRLVEAMREAESGDLKVRTLVSSSDEIGQVAHQFNEMLSKIIELERTKIDTERRLILAQEELRFKTVLEEKAKIISSTNDRLERSLKELSLLYKVSQAVTSSIDLDALCNRLGDVIVENVKLDHFALLLVNERTARLDVKVSRGLEKNDYISMLSFDLGEGVSGKVAQSQQPIYVQDTSKNPDYMYYKGIQTGRGSFLSLPIVSKDTTLGVVNFSRNSVDAFGEGELRLLQTVMGQIAVALENAGLYAKTKELSIIDDLTKVYNRRYFQKILEMECKRAKRFKRPLSLLMLDVDHFKKFNDTFGHLQGDQLLVKMAGYMSDNLREIDTVARYGGEEFAVILPNTSPQDAHQVALKIKNLIQEKTSAEPYAKGKGLTISIGVSTFYADSNSLEDLVNHADIALYKAKAQGRNRVVIYKEGQTSPLSMVKER